MLNILICDDDMSIVTAIQAIVESVLSAANKRARFHTYTDVCAISKNVCPIRTARFMRNDRTAMGHAVEVRYIATLAV